MASAAQDHTDDPLAVWQGTRNAVMSTDMLMHYYDAPLAHVAAWEEQLRRPRQVRRAQWARIWRR